MPRLPRLNVAGAFYMVEQRSPLLFASSDDYALFAELLERRARMDRVSVLGFCFLPDCFALLVRVSSTPVGAFLNYLESAYTRQRRSESQTRFCRPRILLFDADTYLLRLLRELHWRPVYLRQCRDIDEYPWTTHAAYITRSTFPWVSSQPALGLLAQEGVGYRLYMRAEFNLGEFTHSFGLIDPRVLGGRNFVATLPARVKYRTSQDFCTMARSVALALGLAPETIFNSKRARTAVLARAVLAWHCVHRHVATIDECANRLHRNSRTLERAIARYRRLYPQYFNFEGIPDAAPLLPLPDGRRL